MISNRYLLNILFACLCASARSAQIYTVRDLGVQNREAYGASIVNSGNVLFGLRASTAGGSQFYFDGLSSRDLSAIYPANAVLSESGTLLGAQSHGNTIDIYRYTPPGIAGPPDGVVVQLNGTGSYVGAVNSVGTFVGSYGPISTPTAYRSTSDGQFSDLGTLGGEWSYALAINNSDQVVGVSKTSATAVELNAGAPAEEAFLYDNGQMTGLGTLGGQTSYARGINDVGQIVGDSAVPGYQSHAFLYDSSGGMQDIGAPGMHSVAYDINNTGVVVGEQYDPIALLPRRAFLFDLTGGIRYLEDLVGAQSGWTSFLSATGINDRGQIVGIGEIGGEVHIFLLTPVPEPAFSALAILALVSTAVAVRLRSLPIGKGVRNQIKIGS